MFLRRKVNIHTKQTYKVYKAQNIKPYGNFVSPIETNLMRI